MSNNTNIVRADFQISKSEMQASYQGAVKAYEQIDDDLMIIVGKNLLGQASVASDAFTLAKIEAEFDIIYYDVKSVKLNDNAMRYIAAGNDGDNNYLAISDDAGKTWTTTNLGYYKMRHINNIDATKYGAIWFSENGDRVYGSTDKGETAIPAKDVDLRTEKEKADGKPRLEDCDSWTDFFSKMVEYYEKIGDERQVEKWKDKLAQSKYRARAT